MRGQRREQPCEQAVYVEERHHEVAAVAGGQGVGAGDVGHGGGEVGVRERDGFGAAGGAAGVQHERDVGGLGLRERLRARAVELARLVEVECDAVPVPVTFGDGGMVGAGGADGGAVLFVGALWDEGERGAEVVDVEFEFVLFVGRVEWSRDGALAGSREEGDDEGVRIGECDGDGGLGGDAEIGKLLLKGADFGGELRVSYCKGSGFAGDNDGDGAGVLLEGIGKSGHCSGISKDTTEIYKWK